MTRGRLAVGVVLLAALVVARVAGPRGAGSVRATTASPEAVTPAAAPGEIAGLAARLRDKDIDVRVDAAVQLRGFGERAVPFFIDLLRDGDRALAIRSLGKMGAVAAPAVPALVDLLNTDPALRPLLIEAIAAIGDRAAAGPLLPLLQEPDLVVSTLRALARLKPDTPEAALAIAAVIDPRCEDEDLRTDLTRDTSIARLALDALKQMGTAATPALPKLVELIRNEVLLSHAIEAVAAIGPAAYPAVPLLVGVIVEEKARQAKRLQDLVENLEDFEFVGDSFGPYPGLEARNALGAIGEAAIPAVLAMLKHDLEGVRGEGQEILKQMGETFVPHLAAAAVSPDPSVREAAAFVMIKAAKTHPEFLALLAQLAKDEDIAVRRQVAQTLGWYGPEATPLVASLLGETDVDALTATLWSVKRMQPRDPAVLSQVVRLLDHDDDSVRWTAADTLGAMGDAAGAGIAALGACLGDESPYMRDSAAEALAKLGDVAVPVLVANIDLADADAQRRTIALLAARKDLVDEAREACQRMLGSADVAVRVEAAAALLVHGFGSDDLLPVLLAGLKDDRRGTRNAAAKGIEVLGVRAAGVLPDLLRGVVAEGKRGDHIYLDDMLAAVAANAPEVLAAALSDDSSDLRFAAKCALEQIGEPAVPALARILSQGPCDARGDAIEILQRLARKSDAARATLLEASRSAPAEVRIRVLVALWHGTKDAPSVVPGFLELARKGSARAAGYLAEIGGQAAFAIKEIRTAYATAEDEAVRVALARVIEAIESR